jgi:alpha-1,2-mannosyltransferase
MNRRAYFTVALAIWLISFSVVAIMVAARPLSRSVTPLYHEASANWWAGKELYEGPSGMNYLPQFAVLFSPFKTLPSPVGDILWRAVAMGLLAYGTWCVVRKYFGDKAFSAFMWGSILIIPICLGAIRNGQSNAMFGALTLYAVACLSTQQWWRSAVCMGLAFMVKPLGIVLMLLVPAVYPVMFRPIMASLAGSLAFPFLFAAPAYVMAEYHSFFENLGHCAAVTEHRFADISGVILALGGELPETVSKLLRVGAGVLFLGLCFFGGRGLKEPMRFLWLYALATGYLMLFNPMNEHNSYVIFAPALGLWAIWFLRENQTRHLGWIATAVSISMGIVPALLRPLYGNEAGIVWCPLITIVFLGMLVGWIFRHSRASDRKLAFKNDLP